MDDNNEQMGRQQRKAACKKVWTIEEDNQLKKLIAANGTGNWSVIAKSLPSRKGKQCRERWFNHLDPNIKKGEWTPEEDKMILKYQELYGNKWSHITKMLPGRTDNAIKNRWHSTMRGLKQSTSSSKADNNNKEEKVDTVLTDSESVIGEVKKSPLKKKPNSNKRDRSDSMYTNTATDIDENSDIETKKKPRSDKKKKAVEAVASAGSPFKASESCGDLQFLHVFDHDTDDTHSELTETEMDEKENSLFGCFFHSIDDAPSIPSRNSLSSFSSLNMLYELDDDGCDKTAPMPCLQREISDISDLGTRWSVSPGVSFMRSPPLVL